MALRMEPVGPERDFHKIAPALADFAIKTVLFKTNPTTAYALAKSLFGLVDAWRMPEAPKAEQLAWAIWFETVMLFVDRVLRDPVYGRPHDMPSEEGLKAILEPLIELMRRQAGLRDFLFTEEAVGNVGRSRLYTGILDTKPEIDGGRSSLRTMFSRLIPEGRIAASWGEGDVKVNLPPSPGPDAKLARASGGQNGKAGTASFQRRVQGGDGWAA